MITTVTLNAAIDKTYYLQTFELGKVSRVREMHAIPGGKGINVARVVHQLGVESTASGFIGGYNGRFIEEGLAKQGIKHDFVHVDGESRLCLNMIDESNLISTEVLEPGPTVDKDNIEAMKQKIAELAKRSAVVSISGSLPAGAPSDIYRDLIQTAKEQGAKVFLDSSGDALLKGIEAAPFFIKPNEHEVEKIIGKKLENERELLDSLKRLMDNGVAAIAVSLGERGSIAAYEGTFYRVRAPKVQALNAVGSGDSFVAGMAVAITRGDSFEQALTLATACGTANTLTEKAGNVRTEDVQAMLSQVVIEKIG